MADRSFLERIVLASFADTIPNPEDSPVIACLIESAEASDPFGVNRQGFERLTCVLRSLTGAVRVFEVIHRDTDFGEVETTLLLSDGAKYVASDEAEFKNQLDAVFGSPEVGAVLKLLRRADYRIG